MSNIAIALDQQEQQMMAASGTSGKDYLSYMQEGSSNVADDGNYSIQVIQKALENFGGIQAIPLDNPAMKASIKDYCDEQAFVCHSVDHWVSIRKINQVWYNLNSTNIVPPGPQLITDFYLGAFLDSIRGSGYTIFVIKGDLPLPNKTQA